MRKAVAICAVAAIACLMYGFSYYRTYYRNNVADGEFPPVKVYHDYTLDDIAAAFSENGLLKDKSSFIKAARTMDLEHKFKRGLYKFKPGMGNKAIIRMMVNGWQVPTNIVVPGYIRNLEKLAAVLGNNLEADSAYFISSLKDMETMREYGFDEKTFIGMFIPNTYEVWWTISPDQFIKRMYKEYDAFWTHERKSKADKMGLSQNEVSTLASIVIEESKYEPELATIAGVYVNRLNRGIPLQADPTVKFCLNDPSIKRILNTHLEVESPYNTYKHIGLPPGPITIPPICAIDAVLNYKHHDYLYFCAKPTFDGQHAFAVTLAQHNRNADAYHKAYSRLKRQ